MPTETATETATVTETPTGTATPVNGVARYYYDGNGTMVKSVIGEIVTYYASSAYQVKTDGTNLNTRKYYAFGNTTVAMRENDELAWLLTDQVNSTTVTASEDGTLISEIKYTAFGEVRSLNGVPVTYNRYTGQREEVEIGLYFYVARWYDPVLAHFLQADTIVPESGFAIPYDRYAYVNFNPIRFSDPSGHMRSNEDWTAPGDVRKNIIGYGTAGNYISNASRQAQPRPTHVDRSKLTPGGDRVYLAYLEIFITEGWWWGINPDGFTLEDAVAVMVFQPEGGEILPRYGFEIKNGYSLDNAWAEAAARNMFGCSCDLGNCVFDDFGATYGSNEWLANWMYGHNESTRNRVNNLGNGNSGSTVNSFFNTSYISNHAQTVATQFLNPDLSWLTCPNTGTNYPYSWGNDPQFIENYPSLIIWSIGNFYIPNFDGYKK